MACGTGACAVVVAAVLEGHAGRVSLRLLKCVKTPALQCCCVFSHGNFCLNQSCRVDLPGGPLDIEWREEDNHVYMTGPAEVVFYGSVPL